MPSEKPDPARELALFQARTEINHGAQSIVINALVSDLAAARVRIAELEKALSAAKPDAPAAAPAPAQ